MLAETIQHFLVRFLFCFVHIGESTLRKIMEEKVRRENLFNLEDKGMAVCNG